MLKRLIILSILFFIAITAKPLLSYSFWHLSSLTSLSGQALVDSQARRVVVLTIEGAIGPASDDYVAHVFRSINAQKVELLIIRLDTPGGLDTSMRGIVKIIINSPVPVVAFVAPQGARAASAGTYILYASHIAAMSPGTNLGAATPVQIGGTNPFSDKGQTDKKPVVQDAMKRKIINDASAYIVSLAKLHGRNHHWAEKAVREGVSLPADQALKMNVINVIAHGIPDLLEQLDQQTVKLGRMQKTIRTSGLAIQYVEPGWRSRFLQVITNPNIAYFLLLIGMYGLILEFANPGSVVPGTVGAIALILALYSLHLLPVNYTGMALILLGLGLMIAEAFQPSFGILGLGGISAFIIGSIVLMDTDAPGYRVNLSIIISSAVISVLLLIFVLRMALQARKRPIVSGIEQMTGSEAVVINGFNQIGTVLINGEIWRAQSDIPLHKGEKVKVVQVQGLTLIVEPVNSASKQ